MEDNYKREPEKIDEILNEAICNIEACNGCETDLNSVPSGFIDLDKITLGWHKAELIIVAARPSMGKTAFVLSCVRNAAIDFDKPVAVFTLEMSSVQLANRLLSAETEIDQEKIRKGTLEEWEWQQIHSKISVLEKAPLIIDDTSKLDILELERKCVELKIKYDIQLIVIDYIQLLTGIGGDGKGIGDRWQEIGSITRALKSISKKLNVPIIALSQLSRAVESRPGGSKRPLLSDLSESGSIEQDADMVLFIYRPEYYGLDVDEDNNPTHKMAEVIVAKNRNGQTGRTKLKFETRYVKFTDFVQSENLNDLAAPFGALVPQIDFDRPVGFSIRPSRMDDMEDEPPF